MKSITPHISYSEATKSQTAVRKGLSNRPNATQLAAMKKVGYNCFEPLREFNDGPIAITSFFRSEKVNVAIGGSTRSQHCKGEAIDIDCDTFNNGLTNAEAFHFLKDKTDFDQLIWEFGTSKNPAWVHVSCKLTGKNRGQVLIAERVNGKVTYSHYIDGI